MPDPEIKRQFSFWLLIPITVFGVIVFGAPAWDWADGKRPWRGVQFSLSGLLDGSVTRSIEKRMTSDSAVADTVRPRYNEFLGVAAGVITAQLVEGKDHWLFLRSTAVDYPPPGADAMLDEHVRNMAALIGWLKAQGTEVLVLPLPNKETMAPEKLPKSARGVRSMYGAIVTELRRAGLWVLDARPALDLREGVFFINNDTHWTPAGARRVALAVGAAARERFGDAVPGRPVKAIFHQLPDEPRRGDLQRMLGFVPGSAADSKYTCMTSSVYAARDDSGPVVDDSDLTVVVCGTSFTAHFGFASMVAGGLQRYVADRSVPARGPLVMLADLVDTMRAGRAAPRFIVWEIPEPSFFFTPGEFIEPLRALVTRLATEDSLLGSRRALTWTSSTSSGLLLAPTESKSVLGSTDRDEAWVEVTLDRPAPAGTIAALTFRARADRVCAFRARAFAGTSGAATVDRREIRGDQSFDRVTLALDQAAAIERIRLEVLGGPVHFELADLELTQRRR